MIQKKKVWFSLGLILMVMSCVFTENESKTIVVNFNNPNPEALLDNIVEVKVIVISDSNDSLVIYKGDNFIGPWNFEAKKEDLKLLILQLDENGGIISQSEYAYSFSNGTLSIQNKVEISPRWLQFKLGDAAYPLKFKVFPSTLPQKVNWTSANPAIANVSNLGVVAVKSTGNTHIIARFSAQLADSILVNVMDTSFVPDVSLPEITQQPSVLEVYVGETVSFTVTATGMDLNYLWHKDGVPLPGEITSSLTFRALLADSGKAYRCRVYNQAGSLMSNEAILSVLDTTLVPQITSHPKDVTLGEGDTATFSVSVSGSPPFTYQWFLNDQIIENATDSNYSIGLVQSQMDGDVYYVVVTNPLTSLQSESALLHYSETIIPPEITKQPSNLEIYVGETVVFNVIASGTDLNYLWHKNGAAMPEETASSITFKSLLSDNGTAYKCNVYNQAGSLMSAEANLTVLDTTIAPQITSHPEDVTINEGQKASFTVVTSGSPPFTYQWQRNGISINGANSSSFITETLIVDDEGDYTVTVSNSAGQQTSNTATLIVRTKPSITSPPVNINRNVGQTASFSVIATGYAPLTYTWSRNNTLIQGANSPTYTTNALTLADNGDMYSVEVSNVAGSIQSTAAFLTVNDIAPAMPSGFSVNRTGRRTLQLSWSDNSDNETSFRIERSLSQNANFSLLAVTIQNVTSYEDANLSLETIYHYRVRAENAVGNSPWTAVVGGSTWTCGENWADSRDNQIYGTVKIAQQCWFSENLKLESPNSICSDYGNAAQNCLDYGRMYTYNEANNSCPEYWKLPSMDDFTVLQNQYPDGLDLMEPGLWTIDAGITNESGWSARPGGFCYAAECGNLSHEGYWWTSTIYDTETHRNFKINEDPNISFGSSLNSNLLSVRCILD